jgi:hypothetical protein
MDFSPVTKGNARPVRTPLPPKDARPARAGMPRFYSLWLIEGVIDDPLTVESYLDSRKAQTSLILAITAIADRLTSTPEQDDESVNIDSIIHSPRLSVPLFDFLTQTDRLPSSSGGKRIIYHLDGNKLGVEVIPSLCHDSVAAAIGTDLIRWAESGGARDCLLPVLGGDTTLISSR